MSDVTASGNEITDASRIAALEGDGIDAAAKRDGSYGIWEASENLITNGGFETNTAGWFASSAAIARDIGESKFGDASGEFVTGNAAANEGGYHPFGGAAATKYTVTAWVWGTGTVRIALYDNVSGKQASAAVTLTATPQRITKTATTGGGSGTFRVYVETDVQQDITFNVDGVQVEAQPLATPYIETDGGTATRTAARVRMPASLLDETQGWLAMQIRTPYPSTTMPVTSPWAFVWWDDVNNRMGVFLTSANVYMMRRNVGGTGQTLSAHGGFVTDDTLFIIAAWDATSLYISVNGGNFVSATKENIPTLSATTFDVGSASAVIANTECDFNFLWVACGTGVLSNANAAAIAALGSGAYPCDFPAAAVVTACWNADDDSYHEPEEDVRAAELVAAIR